MSVSLKTQKMLWGRAAGRCSMPSCRIDLYEDETETDDPTLVGENCHIVAERDNGPRADAMMPTLRRNTYSNLILLCRNHHKVIDAQEGEYTVEHLHKIKDEHEKWVREQLGLDINQQHDEEQYAGIIDKWERLAHVNEWHKWSFDVISYGQPSISMVVDNDLYKLREWLFNRIWPDRYLELNSAFYNFLHVLQNFQNCFRQYAEPWSETIQRTRKFYQIDEWNKELYDKLLSQYNFHVDLVEDLMLELSRSSNLVCDCVRQFIMRSYRLNEGRIVVRTGPYMDLSIKDYVAQYDPEVCSHPTPYPGLESFLTERTQRDVHFGEGTKFKGIYIKDKLL